MQRYNYFYPDGAGNLFVSKQDNGYFIGSLLYYTRSGSRNESGLTLCFNLQHFLTKSSEDAIRQAETWFKKNISQTFTREEE